MRSMLQRVKTRWSVQNDENTRKQKSLKTYPPKPPKKANVVVLKFPEKTSEAQLIAIEDQLLVMGSWKNRRCIAYKPPKNIKTPNPKLAKNKAKLSTADDSNRPRNRSLFQIMKDSVSTPKGKKNDFKMTFTEEEKNSIQQSVKAFNNQKDTTNNNTRSSLHSRNLSVEFYSGDIHSIHKYMVFSSYPTSILPSGHTCYHFQSGETNEHYILSLGGFNKAVGKHFSILKYNHKIIDEKFNDPRYANLNEMSNYKPTPKSKKNSKDDEKTDGYNEWMSIFDNHSDIPHYGGGARVDICGKDNNLLIICGGAKKGFGIDLFDLSTFKYVKRFKKILPFEKNPDEIVSPDGNDEMEDKEDFKWAYHGMVRIATNEFVIWKDYLCYLMSYNEEKNDFSFEKWPKHPCNLLGFAYCKINRRYIATFGGLDPESWGRTDNIWLFNVVSKRWKMVERVQLPNKLWNLSAVLSTDGSSVHLVGGVNEEGHHQSNHWIIKVKDILAEVS